MGGCAREGELAWREVRKADVVAMQRSITPKASPKHPLRGLPRAGELFDEKYRIDSILGIGAMGVVFAATHLRLAERVAIKMLLPEWLDQPVLVERFAREGRASAAVRSEHIVRVLDVDECEGRPYLVLEYLEGKDLQTLLSELGTLSVVSAVDFVLQACEALAEAHVLGTIHRDLKPANLYLTHRADGSPCVKVLDFGISKIASPTPRASGIQPQGTRALLGSPHYMSPEQMMSAEDVDARTDIWSLGAILHELLAGTPPFIGETLTVLCARVATEAPTPLAFLRRDVPDELAGVVLRCLQKDPSRRYANVAELSRALSIFGSPAALASAERISRVLEGGIERRDASVHRGKPVTARPPPRGIAPRAIARGLAVLVALAMLGGVGWKVATHENVVARAVSETAVSEAVAPVPTPNASAAPVPSSIASTTGALVTRPEPDVTPAPAMREAHPAAPRAHHPHSARPTDSRASAPNHAVDAPK